MPFSISNLSPRNILNKIENRFPKIKKITGNPKIKKIAIEVLKGLALSLLAAGFGALICSPFGATMIAIGAISGGVVGGLTFIAVTTVIQAIRSRGFPAHPFCKAPPIPLDDWLTDEHLKQFHDVIEKKLQPEPWFSKWVGLYKRSKSKMQHALWRSIQKGVAAGETRALILAAQKNPSLGGLDLLKKISPEDLFYGQLLEIIAKDLAKWKAWPEHATILKTLEEIPPLIKHGEIPFGDLELNDEGKWSAQLKSFIHPVQDEPSWGCLQLFGKEKSHTLFLQFKPSFRFYDSYNPKHGGMHEGFKTEDEWIKTLYSHLKGYHSRIRPSALKFNSALLRAYR